MKRSRVVSIFALLPLAITLLSSGGSAYAAGQAITITPTSNSPDITPGTTYKGSFEVLNQGGTAFAYQVYSAPYRVSGEDYTPDFTVLPDATNVAGWFKLASNGGHITPGQTNAISYTITVPKNTTPGGYYAAIFAQTNYPKTANSITLNERVGEIFYIEAAGPVTKKGELLSWQSAILQKPPLTATLRLENDGGVHYPATINVAVKDIFGRSKYTLNTTKEILPQTIRRVSVSWNTAPAIGLFKVTGSVSFLNQNKTLGTKWVLVMSQTVRLILIGILILVVLFIVFRLILQRRSTRKRRR